MARRKFLFLQGVATPFFKELSKAISSRGHETYRVNFCGGDALFSIGTKSWRFNQPIEQLPNWLEEKHHKYHFTDIVLFGDTRPVHKSAIALLQEKGVSIHVYEEGYLRPNWVTLESNGVNGHSELLKKPAEFWHKITDSEETDKINEVGKTFGIRATHDINYRLANALLKPLFPYYRTHRPANALLEYAGWATRLPTIKLWRARKDNRTIRQLIAQKQSFYLFPLQLDSDSQIKVHSPYNSIEHAIERVLSSFAQNAPSDALLVVKNHPLATGLIDHYKQVMRRADSFGIRHRIRFLEAGHLPTLLKNTAGTILVNSTTGTSALYHGSPTCALGKAIFDIPGLTFQDGLDRFWAEGVPADKNLYRSFRHTIIKHTQINGDFYSRRGIKLAIEGSLARLNIEPVSVSITATETVTNTEPLTTDLLPITSYGGKLPSNSYMYRKH